MADKKAYNKLKKTFPDMDISYALKQKKNRGTSLKKTDAGRKRAARYVKSRKKK